ncbi:MAG: DUF4163 domain-containing protein [Clostridia bacterium]|nr:DUF4163 domain-containing protein [Clostridia bacterium]
MKKLVIYLMSIFLVVGMAGCAKSDSTGEHPGVAEESSESVLPICVTVGEEQKSELYADRYEELVTISYPKIFLCNGDETKYSGLSRALDSYNRKTMEKQMKFMNDCLDSGKEYSQMMDSQTVTYESKINLAVRRADTRVTSFLCCDYSYGGGAHGNYFYYGKNFDTKTGEPLKLSQVVNDTNALTEAIKKQLKVFWSVHEEYDEAIIANALSDVEQLSWTLDYNGITVYFSPYEIASYAAGVQVVTLSNEEYPDILKSEYQEVPKAYGVEFLSYTPFYTDVTGDGKVDELFFSAYNDEDATDTGYLSVSVNDTYHEEETWFYEAKATLLHTKDGKNYLYAELLQDSDYRDIRCYEFSDSVTPIGKADGGLRSRLREEETVMFTYDVLTNPEAFQLERRTQHLSTVSGYKTYAVGQNGLPETRDLRFHFDDEQMLEFSLLQDFEAEIYDEDKETVTGNQILKQGDKVLYYSTDNETYAYFKQSDGTILRVQTVLDAEHYYHTIHGMKPEELFDGILFAG